MIFPQIGLEAMDGQRDVIFVVQPCGEENQCSEIKELMRGMVINLRLAMQ